MVQELKQNHRQGDPDSGPKSLAGKGGGAQLGSGTRGRCGWAQRVNQPVELLSHQSGRETERNKSGGVMDDTILSFLKMLRAFERKAVLKGSRRRFHDGLACWDTLTYTNDKISAQLRGKRAPHRKGGAFQYQRMTTARVLPLHPVVTQTSEMHF